MWRYDDELIDDLETWEEVAHCLADEWTEVLDRDIGLRVERDHRSVLVREPSSATAKQRRLLHRAGLRVLEPRCWSWTPPDPDPAELEQSGWVPELPGMRERVLAGRIRLARNDALADMALRILRDVMGCVPVSLTVEVMVEWEDWDEGNEELAAAERARAVTLMRRGGPMALRPGT